MQQRVALARALAPQPEALLLDEPLSALDAKVRENLRAEIRELQHRLRITTIMVTHDQEEAMEMADRIVVMNQGRIEQIGSADDIYWRPSTRFVGEFIGRINILDAASWRNGLNGASATDGEVLAIRPEHVRIVEGPSDEPVFEGTVRRAAFLGNTTRLVVEAEGGRKIEIEVHGTAKGLATGTRLQFALPRANLNRLATSPR